MQQLITVCIATYKRILLLQQLLESLACMEIPVGYRLEIVIIDNECSDETKNACRDFSATSGMVVHYFAEEQKGISYVRNRALREASDETTWLAFVDDDEVVDAGWLFEMHLAISKYEGDVFTGPVYPKFNAATQDWVKRGGFFAAASEVDGAFKGSSATNNVIFKYSLIEEFDMKFNLEYNLTGGEDYRFFKSIVKKGGKIRWVRNAVVYEHISTDRGSVKWLFQRQFRLSNNSHLQYLKEHQKSVGSIFTVILKSAGRTIEFLCLCLFIPFLWILGRKELAVKVLQFLARGLGGFMAIANYAYKEYK
ncbi:MAG: glycosyltransferase family 2 protein [Bacteroidia bacterium]